MTGNRGSRVIRSSRSTVYLSWGLAVKHYRKPHQKLAIAEVHQCSAAQSSPIGPWVVPVRQIGNSPFLYSERGQTVTHAVAAGAVSAMVDQCLQHSKPFPATAVINFPEVQELLAFLHADFRQHIINVISKPPVSELPFGPAHGDVHIGNIVALRGKAMLIDWLSFREFGCPLWDLAHFSLEEIRHALGKASWIDVVAALDQAKMASIAQLVGQSSRAFLYPYALQRIAREASVKRTGANIERVMTGAAKKLGRFTAVAQKLR